MSEEFWLEIEEDGRERRVRLTGPETAIGRDADNAIVVRDRRSSRHHCRLVIEPRGLVLEDLGSRNGTVLKGTTVTRSVVESGDEFSIGKTRFTVRRGAMPAAEDVELEEPDGAPEDAAAAGAPGDDLLEVEEPDDSAAEDDAALLERTAEARAGEPSGAIVDDRSGSETVVLECIGGDHQGETFRVARFPFSIGRRSANDLELQDQRASGKHARIVREGGLFYVEDLGSRNGTHLDRRAVTRGLLVPGSVLSIGSSRFRVRVPRSEALARAMKRAPTTEEPAREPAEERADEDLGRFEVEAFEGAARAEHPLAVVVIVLLLGVICYFSIDVARRILIRPPLDRPGTGNELGDAWSFEAPTPEGQEGAVPGWKVWDDDRGGLRVGSEFAQYPGRQALHLDGAAGAGVLTRAVFDAPLSVRGGARYRVGGFVRNQGAFAAGFLVEWLRELDGEAVVVERSFSDTARDANEVLNVDQIITAPGSISRARFSCFVLGGTGRSVFDRVVFAPLGDPAAGEEPDLAAERSFRFGSSADGERASPAPLTLRLGPDGTMALARGRRVVVPRLWIGLGPDVDTGLFGARLAALRILSEESGALTFVAQLPDPREETWVTVEASMFVAPADLTLRLRSVSSRDGEDGSSGPAVGLYFEPGDPAATLRFPGSGEEGSLEGGDVPPGAQGEMILGEKGGQIVFGFSPDAYLAAVEHPHSKGRDGRGRRVLVASGRRDELSLRVSVTSRLEREATLRMVREADGLYRADRVGAAVELLEQVPALFPEQSAEIELASARIERWRQEGATALDDLRRDLATLRASPGPVLYGVLGSRAADVEKRFAGMPPAAGAAQVASEAREFWEAEAAKQRAREIDSIYERGREHFVADRLGLAKLYLSRVIELGAETSRARQAAVTLESIEKRRSEHRASHLK